jgi:tuberous sclerosis protein 2
MTGYVWSGTAPSQRRKDVAIDPSYLALQLSPYPSNYVQARGTMVTDQSALSKFFRTFDRLPVIDTHKVGVLYVAPGQTNQDEILANTYGSPAYTRFLEGLGRLINLRGQKDVYAGGLDPEVDGEYAYAWWDDIGQILYHTATLMPTHAHGSEYRHAKMAHIGNDYVRIVWNDSGFPYDFDTIRTQFQFVNILIEPHSRGAAAAFSDSIHENEYFKVTAQRAPGMPDFLPVGDFKIISAESLPLFVRQLSLLSDWFAYIFLQTDRDSRQEEVPTHWRERLRAIKRFGGVIRQQQQAAAAVDEEEVKPEEGIMAQRIYRDFSAIY